MHSIFIYIIVHTYIYIQTNIYILPYDLSKNNPVNIDNWEAWNTAFHLEKDGVYAYKYSRLLLERYLRYSQSAKLKKAVGDTIWPENKKMFVIFYALESQRMHRFMHRFMYVSGNKTTRNISWKYAPACHPHSAFRFKTNNTTNTK